MALVTLQAGETTRDYILTHPDGRTLHLSLDWDYDSFRQLGVHPPSINYSDVSDGEQLLKDAKVWLDNHLGMTLDDRGLFPRITLPIGSK